MVVEQNQDNKTNQQNPLIDTGQVTVNAFNAIKNKEKHDKNFILGRDDNTLSKSPNHKVKVKAWTQDDDKTHTYFHSLSIDCNVDDFMGTAELKCPYDSDLMEYWEPIRQTVVIYGSNQGDYKILFIGRVRELKQDGYELVITFQNYGWKFKQLVTQSYANDNVLNKDGYTIMKLMFEALKIDSYVISESAKNRLKEVGINSDGNLTLNGEELKEDYLDSSVETRTMGEITAFTVPEGYVFCMGDNRSESKDCRSFGCIPQNKIESRVKLRFWPFSKFGGVD